MTDVLARIDAAVQQQCACGCGSQLDLDGPSGWFASQTCQERWHQQHTTAPQEVLQRPDPGQTERHSAGVAAPVTGVGPLNPFASSRGSYWCPECGRVNAPELIDDIDDVYLWTRERVTRVPSQRRCPDCAAPVPLGLCFTVLVSNDDSVMLRVEYGGRRAQHHLSDSHILESADPQELFRTVWVQLQQDVRGNPSVEDAAYRDGNPAAPLARAAPRPVQPTGCDCPRRIDGTDPYLHLAYCPVRGDFEIDRWLRDAPSQSE